MFGTSPPNPAPGASTHIVVHRVGVDEVSQEIAAPEEDDVPQDVRDQTAAMAKRGLRCKRVLVLLSEVSSPPSPPENASL